MLEQPERLYCLEVFQIQTPFYAGFYIFERALEKMSKFRVKILDLNVSHEKFLQVFLVSNDAKT